ncbi:MAG: hypothetical protein JNK14_10340 [Chitinophagaceae bacterium]|nr:hypothetical protein [Chitinophagaceae bacterium]
MKELDITPIGLRDYAISLGWTIVAEAIRDGLFVLNSPNQAYKQLVFPKDPVDFSKSEAVHIALSKLAHSINLSEFSVIERIREVNEDVITLRYYSENKSINSLSFQEAIDAIEGTKDMLLAAASTVVSPKTYHPRLSRNEAVDLIKKTKFRHTEEGSFVLKISCPIEMDITPTINLFGETQNLPFTRQTFSLVNLAANELINSIETNTQEEFVSIQKQSDNPIISYNFCDSIINLFDEQRESPFDLNFRWSPSFIKKLPSPNLPTTLRVPYSFKSKFEEIKSELKPETKVLTDSFIATVESLNGDIGNDGKRSGEIRLSVLLESEVVNARVILNADQYEIADKAHMNPGSYIKVRGKLNPGKNIRLLNEVTDFALMQK